MADSDPLKGLQDWYCSQCNGDWEHGYGVSIETLDNPGWSLKIELKKPVYLIERLKKLRSAVRIRMTGIGAECGAMFSRPIVGQLVSVMSSLFS